MEEEEEASDSWDVDTVSPLLSSDMEGDTPPLSRVGYPLESYRGIFSPAELGPARLFSGMASFVGDSVSILIHPLLPPCDLVFFFFPRDINRDLPCCRTAEGEGYEDVSLLNPERGLRGDGIRDRSVEGESAVSAAAGEFGATPEADTTIGRSSARGVRFGSAEYEAVGLEWEKGYRGAMALRFGPVQLRGRSSLPIYGDTDAISAMANVASLYNTV